MSIERQEDYLWNVMKLLKRDSNKNFNIIFKVKKKENKQTNVQQNSVAELKRI